MSDAGRVLIVDDEPDLTAGFRMYLELDGFVVFVHTSLITLPMVIRSMNPDLILLDLSMPALSGHALFKVGVHRVLRTDAPVVLFSGRDPRELSRLAEELGADGFLPKQTDVDDASRRIGTWITQRRALQGEDQRALLAS
jgi:DNA-binding response OmpR family regulator